MKKQYVIESKGFTEGIGSTKYSEKRNKQIEDLKRQLRELEYNKKDIDKSCFNCEHCQLYENENTQPSNTNFCEITEDIIDDIEQYYCDKFKEI